MGFLIFQMLCYFSGIAFSTGGGNNPEQQSSSFIYLKALLIMVPVLSVIFKVIIRPAFTLSAIIQVIKQNLLLCLYFAMCFLVLPFAVNWEYSLIRLSYTLFQLISLFCLLSQFQYRFLKDDIYTILKDSLHYLSLLSLVLPIYVLVINRLSVDNFRFALQSINLIHPNILASFYALLLTGHMTVLTYSNENKHSAFVFIAILAILEALLFSRTAILALIIGICMLPFLNTVFKKSTKSLLISLGLLFLAMTTFVLTAVGILSIDDILSIFTRNDTVSSMMTLTKRTVLWSELLSRIDIKVFFLGYGYSVISENYGIDFGTGILYGAHNAYLSVLLGSGIVSFLFIIFYLIRNIIFFLSARSQITYVFLINLITSYIVFFIICFSSEEMGINLSINFSYLIFLTNMAFLLKEDKRT